MPTLPSGGKRVQHLRSLYRESRAEGFPRWCAVYYALAFLYRWHDDKAQETLSENESREETDAVS